MMLPSRTFARGVKTSALLAVALIVTWSIVTWRSSRAADPYPSHPIRVVVPFAPGGAVDLIARLTAQYLTREFGQRVYVDNRGGAGGTIGSAFVAGAPADGYTLKADPLSSSVIDGLVYPKLPYDPRHAFAPIAELAETPTLLVINAGLPATTLQQFVALARRNPGKFNFGSTGVGGSVHLEGVLFESMTGTKLVHVPFRGAGPAVAALVAGETQMQVGSVSAFLPFIRAGKLRALCVNSEHRSPLFPDVPTAAEAGLSGFILPDWYALFAPSGTAAPIIARLHDAVAKSLADPQMQRELAAAGFAPVNKSTAAFGAYWQQQFDFWAPIVKASGIAPE
jgi:tripartite-type tricarboxylate transporter receptor subunit TctC